MESFVCHTYLFILGHVDTSKGYNRTEIPKHSALFPIFGITPLTLSCRQQQEHTGS